MKRVALFILLTTGCGEKWDVDAIARDECSSFEIGYRTDIEMKVVVAEGFAKGDKSYAPLLRLEREFAAEKLSYDRDAFMTKCRPYIAEAIGPCAKEYKPKTDSADQCVKRRVDGSGLESILYSVRGKPAQ